MNTNFTDPLTNLPPHILAHITGDRRRRLVEYLLRWGAPAAALACLECWLAAQPHLATLREAAARAQLDLGRAEAALASLDEIDAERGMSEGRRALRLRALAALGRWGEAHALLPDRPDDAGAWRLRAELLVREGRLDQAAQAYARAAALLPEAGAPLLGQAELALARGDFARARALLRQRQSRLPEAPLDTRTLVLLRTIAECQGDAAQLAALDAQLHQRRMAEQAAICAGLGLDPIATEKPETGRPGDRETGRTDAERIDSLGVSWSPGLLGYPEPELPGEVQAALRRHFGHDSFRPGQAAIVERVLRGDHVLGVLPTGAGKSLTYQLPALLLPGATLVLSPLIALMKDQVDNLPTEMAARATTIHSALDPAEVAARLRGVAAGRYKLIYVAPERLRQQPFVHALRRAGVARVVVDEAHCVSLWGISFRPDYLFIRRALAELGDPPLLALTATATPEIEAEIKAHLSPGKIAHSERQDQEADPPGSSRPLHACTGQEMQTIRTSIFRPNLRFEVGHAANKRAKLTAVLALCREIDGPVVVYVRSRDGCEEVAAYLREGGVGAEHYHAQVADRPGVQDRFMRGSTRVLVATVAFGMGVDKADIRAIVHYNLPQSVEAYYQEAGRAGRDGLPARCVLLYAPSDKGQLTAWLREEAISRDYLREVYRWLRLQIPDGWGVVALDDLRRDLREQDETRMRVALGLLERVGLLTRHFDLPRAATLLLRDGASGDAVYLSFVRAARLRPGQPIDVNLIDLAARCGCTPDEIERRLLRWHDQGLLRYEGGARDVLLELRPAGAGVSGQIEALLAEYRARQDARVEAIAGYARGVTCRHRAIAAHFGERLAPCGDACDICAPGGCGTEEQGRRTASSKHRSSLVPSLHSGQAIRHSQASSATPRPSSPAQIGQIIVRCLTQLPFPVGKSGLSKILKGAAGSPIGPERCAEYAALSHMTGTAIEAAIERLVEQGTLRRSSGARPLLALADRSEDRLPANMVQ